ncbi:MAG: histidine kinase [Comamonadaceae bacterium CG12_big_fil_rev_8_21_14_0_65_59_15]|nr:MAG: histidine kinase [Comamonadaceae bacterium CG12_big_fil_rev_8_21_14_0_65_59_15]
MQRRPHANQEFGHNHGVIVASTQPVNTPATHLPNGPLAGPGRSAAIAQARELVLRQHLPAATGLTTPWVERSWQRCLALGLEPGQPVQFDIVTPHQRAQTQEANQRLLQSASKIMQGLGKAISNTGYFAILTNAQGIVLDTSGPIDQGDLRASLITRIGTDLSERAIGTSAIGTALAELQPVWLHRGEHFFLDNTHYTCAGAPLFDPHGQCMGMLDLTGVDVPERTELKHLVMQSAAQIENAQVLATPHQLMLRLNWPGHGLGSTADALLGLDDDGFVSGANSVARQIVPGVATGVHANDLFGLPFQALFDAARRSDTTLDVALRNGLRLRALATRHSHPTTSLRAGSGVPEGVPMRQMQASMIRQAMEQTGGNVAEAAQALGISRATLYRKLGRKG